MMTSVYADDTTVFVSDNDSIVHLLNLLVLEKLRAISGLQVNSQGYTPVNTSKTKALWLGIWKARRESICALDVLSRTHA